MAVESSWSSADFRVISGSKSGVSDGESLIARAVLTIAYTLEEIFKPDQKKEKNDQELLDDIKKDLALCSKEAKSIKDIFCPLEVPEITKLLFTELRKEKTIRRER
ncbi:hypothetical protein GF382_00695 [Candidatus Falkowbacteria bacterium]|nr:hypothetical protein [Candidatus Falkowbacteria bacterium]